MPANTIYVGRPTKWGNPYAIGKESNPYDHHIVKDRKEAVELYNDYIESVLVVNPNFFDKLKGKNLACWCALDQPCHVDVIFDKIVGLPPDTEVSGIQPDHKESRCPCAEAQTPREDVGKARE